MKLDWNDISIVPSTISNIGSRSEIDIEYSNGLLPIFTAPMDKVIDLKSASLFGNKLNICMPRGIEDENYFESLSLKDAIDRYENETLPKKILIDVANGNMSNLYNISKKIKEKYGDSTELMIGNIANPKTYKEYCEIGVDYVRVGVGGGSACLTAENVGIFYPMASLVMECNKISKKFKRKTKIIADGGFKKYSDIIKALACGADYVMIGGILSKCIESCSENYIIYNRNYKEIDSDIAIEKYEKGIDIYKKYRGMSTKEVQINWNREQIKTSEGIVKYNKVEYTFSTWVENFEDYLRSCMSYTNSKNLNSFVGKAKVISISSNSYDRFSK